jgi:hypothetical protein
MSPSHAKIRKDQDAEGTAGIPTIQEEEVQIGQSTPSSGNMSGASGNTKISSLSFPPPTPDDDHINRIEEAFKTADRAFRTAKQELDEALRNEPDGSEDDYTPIEWHGGDTEPRDNDLCNEYIRKCVDSILDHDETQCLLMHCQIAIKQVFQLGTWGDVAELFIETNKSDEIAVILKTEKAGRARSEILLHAYNDETSPRFDAIDPDHGWRLALIEAVIALPYIISAMYVEERKKLATFVPSTDELIQGIVEEFWNSVIRFISVPAVVTKIHDEWAQATSEQRKYLSSWIEFCQGRKVNPA